jgi:enamine deaminase RidA (YjgF/YER057c/UK114 family)
MIMAVQKDAEKAGKGGRRVSKLVDAGGVYASRLVSAGDFVFFAGTAVGEDGDIPARARPRPPYHLSASAQVREQTRFIFDEYKEGLVELGSSIDEVAQIEQYMLRKAHMDGYAQVARSQEFMGKRPPVSLITEVGEYLPDGAVINTTGMALIPDSDRGLVKEAGVSQKKDGVLHPGDKDFAVKNANRAFSEIITAGPYAFSTYIAIDYVSGILPEAKVPLWSAWENEVRKEAECSGKIMEPRLEATGSTWADMVNFTLILTDMDDLYEFDLVWKELVGDTPPSRTVFPIAGMAMRRVENVKGHEMGVCKMESQYRWLRPEYGVKREVISTGAATLGHESEAVKAGDLLWISNMVAGGPDGPISDLSTRAQLDHLFQRLEAVCEAGGTTLRNMVRIRAYVLSRAEGYAVYAAVKRAFPENPPCVSVSIVPAPLQVPGCTILLDGVAYVPGM